MTKKKAEDLLRFWQGHLRLLDWDIAVAFCRYHDMDNPKHCAEISYQLSSREAWIRILTPSDIPEDTTPRDRDVEHSIVHELLHLVTWPWSRSSVTGSETTEYYVMEFGLDNLARALVTLRRAATGEGNEAR